MQYLVSAGAIVNQRGKDGQTSLHWAAIRGFVRSAITLLDSGADIDIRDDFGFTPFLRAVQSGHMGLANLLLASGAVIDNCDNEGHNAMHWAAYYGFINMCELLHRKSPLLIHSVDHGGLTPYMIACRSGFIGTINMLVGMGSSADAKDNASHTGPDHLALHHPHLSNFAVYQRNIAKFPWFFRPWLPKNVCNPTTHNCLKTVLALGYVHWILYIIPLTMYLLWSHILLGVATPFLWFVSPFLLLHRSRFDRPSMCCVCACADAAPGTASSPPLPLLPVCAEILRAATNV
jgi:ankyrin repeat protein